MSNKYFFIDETKLGKSRDNSGYGLATVSIDSYDAQTIGNLIFKFNEYVDSLNLDLKDKLLVRHFTDWNKGDRLKEVKRS